MNKFYGHLHTINTHRRTVRKLCFKMGLYWQGLTHDLSKYSPVEFWSGVKYFQGNRSPIDAEKKALGYSKGWLHHKGRNAHHWQYWADMIDGELKVNEMPMKYIKEQVCDRIAACKTYQKEKYHDSSALEFFYHSKESKLLPPKTYKYIEHYLKIVAENPLDKAIKMIKEDTTTF